MYKIVELKRMQTDGVPTRLPEMPLRKYVTYIEYPMLEEYKCHGDAVLALDILVKEPGIFTIVKVNK